MTTLDQTATPVPDDDGFPVFIWFGQPDVGNHFVLMAITDNTTAQNRGGVETFRPLIALSPVQALGQSEIAQDAATELGVTAVCREFRYVALLDRKEPGE